jgi:hypothetical protein
MQFQKLFHSTPPYSCSLFSSFGTHVVACHVDVERMDRPPKTMLFFFTSHRGFASGSSHPESVTAFISCPNESNGCDGPRAVTESKLFPISLFLARTVVQEGRFFLTHAGGRETPNMTTTGRGKTRHRRLECWFRKKAHHSLEAGLLRDRRRGPNFNTIFNAGLENSVALRF